MSHGKYHGRVTSTNSSEWILGILSQSVCLSTVDCDRVWHSQGNRLFR